ncbi:hypothetical protein [Burkholderia stabilis]|uniref:hypothetical protein n=1 Tax=Burkholderia stabilis TaxID=95485 RepID=UPI00159077DA|nr:hypothetical protein [Burkholderia stabilis]
MAAGEGFVVPLPPVAGVVPVPGGVPVVDALTDGDELTSSPPHPDSPIAAATKHVINIPNLFTPFISVSRLL